MYRMGMKQFIRWQEMMLHMIITHVKTLVKSFLEENRDLTKTQDIQP